MGDPTKRIRGRRLQERRRRWFMLYPLCVHCKTQGRISVACELDHIVPLFKGGADDDTNLQGLCEACHAVKTADDLGHAPAQCIGVDGWPI